VAGYVVSCCAITMLATWLAPETHRAALDAAEAAEAGTP